MTDLPSKAAIRDWIAENPTETTQRDIARAFGIKGAARIDLKRLLREMEEEGDLPSRRASRRDRGRLPPVGVIEVTGTDADGDLTARPLEYEGEAPLILVIEREGEPALGPGDRVLARLAPLPGTTQYEARVIRRIGTNPLRILGVFRRGHQGGRILPVDKGASGHWTVAPGHEGGAKDGELVEAEQAGPKARLGQPRARIIARLGDPSAPRAISLIAIHQHNIPDHFPDAAMEQADAARPAGPEGRTDLTHIPFVTIDPADARDRDDAVFAAPDDDPANSGGHVIWIGIADVAYYVTPQSALDREARKRGNSTYFPDRVVPMLPDRLSGDLCSLHEDVPRACIAVRIRISAQGRMIGHEFHRGLMKSRASLEYGAVEQAVGGAPEPEMEPLVEPILKPLFAAYGALKLARAERQPLDLDLPERQIILDDMGKVVSVAFKERLDAHRLIEEFMVLANVAAAEVLIARQTPLLFRVHEEPNPDKIDALREVAQASGLVLAKGQQIRTLHLNRLLRQAEGTDQDELINMATLRSMTQAYYAPQNLGHFGLALRNYAHFTSPIRRYSDLIVHRALISAHGWGRDGLSPEDIEMLDDTAEQISDHERRSMQAERDTVDRYLAAYLADRVGAEFGGRISGVQKFGLFVKLDDSGADALVPVRSLGAEFFRYDAEGQSLTGTESDIIFRAGQRVTVKLSEVTPLSGGLTAELVTHEDQALPRPGTGRHAGKGPRRKLGQAKGRAAAEKRKVRRVRH